MRACLIISPFFSTRAWTFFVQSLNLRKTLAQFLPTGATFHLKVSLSWSCRNNA